MDEWNAERAADYWLSQTVDISLQTSSAEEAMGAAVMLHRLMKRQDVHSEFVDCDTTFGWLLGARRKTSNFESENKRYERLCSRRCIELASLATQLDPTDVRWWRLRASLLFFNDGSPKTEDWRSAVVECQDHDQSNGFYDYLIAQQLFREAATIDFVGPDYKLKIVVKDANLLREAMNYVRKGQAKKYWRSGIRSSSVPARFLSRVGLANIDQLGAPSAGCAFDEERLCGDISFWLQQHAEKARQRHHPREEAVLHMMQRKLAQQTSPFVWHVNSATWQNYVWDASQRLSKDHPTIVSQQSIQELKQLYEEFYVDFLLRVRSYEEDLERRPMQHPMRRADFMAVTITIQAIVNILLAMAIVLLLKWFRRGSANHRLGFVRTSACWVGSLSLSFAVFGLFPAEIPSRHSQWWIWGCVLTALVLWSVIYSIILTWKRRRTIRFSLRTTFLTITAIAILLAIVPIADSYLMSFYYDGDPWPSPASWLDSEARSLSATVNVPQQPFHWAVIQWFANSGVSLTIILSILAAGVWHGLMLHRNATGFDLGSVLSGTARSCRTTMLALVILYLFFAASVVQWAERNYQQDRLSQDQAAYWQSMESRIRKYKQDPLVMKKTLAEARQLTQR